MGEELRETKNQEYRIRWMFASSPWLFAWFQVRNPSTRSLCFSNFALVWGLGFRTKRSYLTAQCGDAQMGPCTRWSTTRLVRVGARQYTSTDGDGENAVHVTHQYNTATVDTDSRRPFPYGVRSDSFDGWNASRDSRFRTPSSAARSLVRPHARTCGPLWDPASEQELGLTVTHLLSLCGFVPALLDALYDPPMLSCWAIGLTEVWLASAGPACHRCCSCCTHAP